MFAPALGTEGRSEILECLSLLQCVSSRVLDCYCFWYFGSYHSFCLVDVYFKSLASMLACGSNKLLMYTTRGLVYTKIAYSLVLLLKFCISHLSTLKYNCVARRHAKSLRSGQFIIYMQPVQQRPSLRSINAYAKGLF